MRIATTVLIKGLSDRQAKKKDGTPYRAVDVDLYSLDGKGIDLKAKVNMTEGEGLLQKLGKLVLQKAQVVMEYTTFKDGNGSFELCSVEAVK